jgi:hypothetical protein
MSATVEAGGNWLTQWVDEGQTGSIVQAGGAI